MRSFLRPSVGLLVVGVLAVLGLTAAGASVSGTRVGPPATATPAPTSEFGDLQDALQLQVDPGDVPKAGRSESSVNLASGVLRAAVARLERGETAGLDVGIVENKVRVEVLHDLSSPEARAVIESLGGVVEGEITGLTQALVPVTSLVVLESQEGIRYLRPPLEANVPILPEFDSQGGVAGTPIVGEEVGKTNADTWHSAGYTGSSVKVGIIDYFDGGLWDSAVAAGELPAATGVFCQVLGGPCDLWTVIPDSQHGEGVAEIIHEMAPAADLYLATVLTTTDLQAAIDYFAAYGVDIVSRSLTASYDGPGDGTGPLATVIENAVAAGMTWFSSAGNSAGDSLSDGEYWRREWTDENANGWMDSPTGGEYFAYDCRFANGVRWNDFSSFDPTDYDIYVFDNMGDSVAAAIEVSNDRQSSGALPLEHDIPCRSTDDNAEIDYFSIRLMSEGDGASGDILEFMVNRGGVSGWQNPYSASGPASDTASPGALSVGAVDPALGTSIAGYSSQGPTNDERTKPDLSAASCISGYTYAPRCFRGTSAAAPVAAGAAALVIDAGLGTTPAQLKGYLLSNATVDRGASGPDNVFGAGELILPEPPGADDSTATFTPSPSTTPTGDLVPAATVTPTNTPTYTPTNTSTNTPTHTPTRTPTSTPTNTPTHTPTNTPTHTPTRTPTSTPTPVLVGDTNCDRAVDPTDAALILQLGAGLIARLPCPGGGDADGNGVTDIVDATVILQFSAGMIDSLPP